MLLEGPSASETILSIHGALQTGDAYDFSVPADPADSPIGHETPNGWWVKGQLPNGQFLLARGPRLHVVEKRRVTAEELGVILVFSCVCFLWMFCSCRIETGRVVSVVGHLGQRTDGLASQRARPRWA